MKLLLENWRAYCNEDFNLLCESYNKGTITEARLLNLWEANVDREYQKLLNEGIMDILAVGYQKGKQLVGKAKQAFESALEKLNDWYIEVTSQAYQLIMKGVTGVAQVGGVLKKAYNYMKTWCKAHPIMCTVAKILIVMMIVLAVSKAAHAKVDISNMPGQQAGEGPKDLGVRGGNMLKGILADMTKYDSALEIDQTAHESARAAFELLEKAEQADTWLDLANSSEEGADVLRNCYTQIQDLIAQVKNDEAGVNQLMKLAKQGEQVQRATIELTTNTSSLAREIGSLRVVP